MMLVSPPRPAARAPYADAYFVRGAPAASPDSSDTESGTGAVQPGAGDAESDDDDAGAG